MPTVLRWRGRRFYFYSSDGDEPPHVHVDHGRRTIKIWLTTLKIAYNDGYPIREVRAILGVVDRHRERLLEAWREYFDD
jgi:Domain of unknown function (DUF4160)